MHSKKTCVENGVDVIPEYKESDFENSDVCDKNVTFPILIKPCDSRGSRGKSICNTYDEAVKGIAFAKSESSTGEIVIEKYMGQANDFSMTILILNGKAYPIRTVDRFLGEYKDGLDKLAVGSASPSVFTDVYMKDANAKVEKFAKAIGLVNAPMFMQGFVDGDKVRFYDPGLRLPGGEFERMFTHVFNKNPLYPLIEFALTGQISEDSLKLSPDDVFLNGKVASQILPALKPGVISKIEGWEEIKKHPNVVSAFERFKIGDTIAPTHNVNQRFAEIDIVCNSNEEAADTVTWIYDTLKISDETGNDMIVSRFNPRLFPERNR